MLSLRKGAESVDRTAVCDDGRLRFPAPAGGSGHEGVDPDGFNLLSWNTKKGDMEGWEEDFAHLARDADLLTLQEAYLTEPLRGMLDDRRYQWDLSAAFLNRDREAGVLTGSRTAPDFVCAVRHAEPLVVIPKTFLVSRYPLADRSQSLLVANVHLINFTVATEDYLEQLQGLEDILSNHDGPLLLTGDFNTWSNGRSAAVHGLAKRLSLEEVGFADGELATFFGHTVDRVYYRGLETVDSRAVQVSTSDHNPLLVTFRVPGGGSGL